jgi:predicted ester cyclase
MPRWSGALPDDRFTIEDIVTEGDRGAMRSSLAGTHRGSFRGVPPIGKPFALTRMILIHVKNGRIAECWEDHDELGLWCQLGAKLTDSER